MLKCALDSHEDAVKEIEKLLGKKLSQASDAEKKKAFRNLGKKYHPDMNKGSEEKAAKAFSFVQDVRNGKTSSDAQSSSGFGNKRSGNSNGNPHNYKSKEWQDVFKQKEKVTGEAKQLKGGLIVNTFQGGLNAAGASGALGGKNSKESYSNEYVGKGGLIGQGVGALAGAGMALHQGRKDNYGKHMSSQQRAKIVGLQTLGGSTLGSIAGNVGGAIYGSYKHRSDKNKGALKYKQDGSRKN